MLSNGLAVSNTLELQNNNGGNLQSQHEKARGHRHRQDAASGCRVIQAGEEEPWDAGEPATEFLLPTNEHVKIV